MPGTFNIGRLVVNIAANSGNLQKGLAQAEKQVSNFGTSFAVLGSKAKAALAGIGAGIAAAFSIHKITGMIDATRAMGDSINDMSNRIGMSTQAISELKFAAERSGSSFEEMQAGLRIATKNLAEFAWTGKGEAAAAIATLGDNIETAAIQGSSLETLLPSIAQRFRELGTADRVFVASKLFGRGGTNLIPMLTDDLDALRAKAQELGVTFSTEAAAGAGEYDDALVDMKSSLVGLRNAAITPIFPVLTSALKNLTDVFSNASMSIREFSTQLNEIDEEIAEDKAIKEGTLVPDMDAVNRVRVALYKSRIEELEALLADLQNEYQKTVDVLSGPISSGMDSTRLTARLTYLRGRMEELGMEADGLKRKLSEIGSVPARGTSAAGKSPAINTEVWGESAAMVDPTPPTSASVFGKEAIDDVERLEGWMDKMNTDIEVGKENLKSFNSVIKSYVDQIGTWQSQAADLIVSTWQSLSQGIGDALAGAIVYGESLGEAMLNVMKQVAAGIISMLVQIGLQQLASFILGQTILSAKTAAELTGYGAITAAAAYASSIAYFTAAFTPLAGPEMAAAYAQLAVTGMTSAAVGGAIAGSAAGMGINLGSAIPGLATGGIVTQPTFALIGEAGPEAVIPLKGDDRFGASQTIQVILDGRVLAKSVVPNMPGVLRYRLGNTI